MKKSKRSFDLEEKEPASSKDAGIGFDLDDEEDEILDLEDIFELPDEESEDDDGLDVEILDADLDESDEKTPFDEEDAFGKDFMKGSASDGKREKPAPARGAKPAPKEPEEDILKDLSFLEDLESESDSPKKGDEEEDLLKGLSFDEPKSGAAKDDDLSGGIIDAADLEALLSEIDDAKPAAPAAAEPAAPVAPPKPAVSAPAVDLGASALDDFVAQIEAKLVDTVREMVESRLPEIVRTVLREEIEKLKDEMN